MLTFKHPSKPYILSAQYTIVNEHITIQWQLLNTQTCLVEKNGSTSFLELEMDIYSDIIRQIDMLFDDMRQEIEERR